MTLDAVEKMTVAELIRANPKTLEIFDKYGVHFCAGCYLTLTDSIKKVAGYHAVDNRTRFYDELRRAAAKAPKKR